MSSSGLQDNFDDLQQGGGEPIADNRTNSCGILPEGLLDALEDVVLAVRPDGTILSANAAVYPVFGQAPSHVVGRNLSLLLPYWTSQLSLESNANHVPAFRLADIGRHADGREFDVRISMIESGRGLHCLIRPSEVSVSLTNPATSQRSSRIVFWTLRLPDGRMHWDPTTAQFFGFPVAAPPPTWPEFLERIEGDEDQWFEDSLAELNEASEEVEFEFRFRRPSGDTIWVRSWAHAEQRGDELIIHGSAIETTLMWEARSALFETSQYYRAALQASLDCFFLLESVRNESGTITDFLVLDINSQSEAMLNLTADELIGRPISRVLRADLHRELFEKYRAVAETRVPVQEELCIPVAYSRPVWIQHQVVPVGNGVAIKSRDISSEKRTERELQLNKFAVDNAAEAMLIIAEDGRVLEVNETGLQRLGRSSDELGELWIWDIDTRQTAKSWPRHVRQLREETRLNLQSAFRRPDGTEMPVEVASAIFEFESQTYICSFARDVSASQAAAAKVAELNHRLESAYDATLQGWSRALDMRDDETEFHSSRVTRDTVALAELMGVSGEELVHIRRGSLLHDIGKMAIPDEILHKPGDLTAEEWEIMRQHPVFAYDMLKPIEYLAEAIAIPYCHHEKWDGTGYPRGLKGEEIPLAARIFAIIDVFDALRSERPYRPAWPKDKVLDHIRQQVGTHFDPVVAEAFFAMHETPVLGMAEVGDPSLAPRQRLKPHAG